MLLLNKRLQTIAGAWQHEQTNTRGQ